MSPDETTPSPTESSKVTSKNSPRRGRAKTDFSAISSGLDAVKAKSSPDPKDDLENKVVSDAQNQHLIEQILDLQANRTLKAEYATKVYRYLVAYSSFCAVVIFLQGWRLWGFCLDATALTVLVGSTAVAAIGLVGFVVQGLFKGITSGTSSKKNNK